MWPRFLEPQQWGGDGVSVAACHVREVDRFGAAVRDTQTASGVNKAYLMSVRSEMLYQFRGPLHGNAERGDIGDLRTNMQTDSRDRQISGRCGFAIEIARRIHGDAELMLLQSGCNIRMSLCGNVSVDPDRNTGLLAQFGRALSQQLEFGFLPLVEQ